MIWLKIKKLEDKISQNHLTEKEGFYYYLATAIYSILYLFYTLIISYNHPPQAFYYFVVLLITILGLIKVFQVNNKIDGKDFFKRYFAITWVIRIKLLIASLIFLFICMNIFDLRKESNAKNVIYLIFGITIYILFYVLAIKSFNRIKIRNLRENKSKVYI